MKIISIEPTPSPNTMKLNLDQRLPHGVQKTYTPENIQQYPEPIQRLLSIDGVKSLFQVADFIALERKANGDWQEILSQAREILGEDSQSDRPVEQATQQQGWGEVQVFVQMFRGIPMQIKLVTESEQQRVGLPQRFMDAAMRAGSSSPNLIMERAWIEQGVRYGEMQTIGEEVASELDAAYDDTRLEQLVARAFEQGTTAEPAVRYQYLSAAEVEQQMADPDWRKRYAALEQMNPTEDDIPLIAKALTDEKASIRRLATVYLGMIGGKKVLPYLYQALKDSSASVRRTAGDALSDIGDPEATSAMAQALRDKNKLVRWRAARFLYEVGDDSALPALREAQDDPEFEVRMQIKIALERIESGEEASGTVWQQMTQAIKKPEQ